MSREVTHPPSHVELIAEAARYLDLYLSSQIPSSRQAAYDRLRMAGIDTSKASPEHLREHLRLFWQV